MMVGHINQNSDAAVHTMKLKNSKELLANYGITLFVILKELNKSKNHSNGGNNSWE